MRKGISWVKSFWTSEREKKKEEKESDEVGNEIFKRIKIEEKVESDDEKEETQCKDPKSVLWLEKMLKVKNDENTLLKKKIADQKITIEEKEEEIKEKIKKYDDLYKFFKRKEEKIAKLEQELNEIRSSLLDAPEPLKETVFLYYQNNSKVRFNTKTNLLETIHEKKKDYVQCGSNLTDTMEGLK